MSAVIPVHDGEQFLGDAIRSVLEQTVPVTECIVVDDASIDATESVAAEFGDSVTYLRQPAQRGVSAARNRGAREARGELVAFLDHDDVWLPAKLEHQLPLFADDTVVLGLCALQVVEPDGSEGDVKHLGPREDLLEGMLMFDGTPTLSCSSTGVVRRDALLEMGGFDERLSMSADWDLLLRVVLAGGVGYVDEPLVRYRVHGGNMSRRVAAMESDMRHAFGKAFANPKLPQHVRRDERKAYGRLYRMLSGSYRDRGELRAAARTLALAISHDPRIALELARSPARLRRAS